MTTGVSISMMEENTMDSTLENFAFPNTSPQPYIQEEEEDIEPSEIILDDYRPSSIINDSEEEQYVTEEDLLAHDPAPSGRSSISSFPASVVHHDVTPAQIFAPDVLRTPSRSRTGTPTFYSQTYKPLSPLSSRNYTTGFRNPSSVRALQMCDEFSDGEDANTPGHRRRSSRVSYNSHYRSGSTHSTPGKRMSRSLQGSPVKSSSRLRKEFPLVLLHCTLLPSLINPKAKGISEDMVEAIIPEPYKKRWKALHEKVMKNSEVRERGVLIPHPKDDYHSLEERLLESLELESPRLDNGHFIGRSESRASVADSGFGSEENSNRGDATDEEAEDSRCTDCGQELCGPKRWEIKVYAANGLMRAPTWAAAWSEMEKVDVQISVFMPEDVRNEVESRLEAVIAQEMEMQQEEEDNARYEELTDGMRAREVYGQSTKQEEIDGLPQVSPSYSNRVVQQREPLTSPAHTTDHPHTHIQTHHPPQNVDLHAALVKYTRLLAQDRRNIAIVLLSVVLVIYAMANKSNALIDESTTKTAVDHAQETKIEYLTTTIVSTSTSIALQTSTITETASVSLPNSPPSFEASILEKIFPSLDDEELGSLSTSQIMHTHTPTPSMADEGSSTTDIPLCTTSDSERELEEENQKATIEQESEIESSFVVEEPEPEPEPEEPQILSPTIPTDLLESSVYETSSATTTTETTQSNLIETGPTTPAVQIELSTEGEEDVTSQTTTPNFEDTLSVRYEL